MLKLFLLIPFFTLNAAMTLGLIYFTVFVDLEVGALISFVVIMSLSLALIVVNSQEYREIE